MMKNRITRRLSSERGGTIVEMAIVLPVFLIMLVGIMQCSILLFNYCNAVYSVRAASRYASLHSGSSGNPATAAAVNSIVAGNLRLAGSGSTPAVMLLYGNSGGPDGGNYVGDLVGVGIVWANYPIVGGNQPFYIAAQSYRIISH